MIHLMLTEQEANCLLQALDLVEAMHLARIRRERVSELAYEESAGRKLRMAMAINVRQRLARTARAV